MLPLFVQVVMVSSDLSQNNYYTHVARYIGHCIPLCSTRSSDEGSTPITELILFIISWSCYVIVSTVITAVVSFVIDVVICYVVVAVLNIPYPSAGKTTTF